MFLRYTNTRRFFRLTPVKTTKMQTLSTVSALQHHLEQSRVAGQTIGFVPTMGALHAGHLSLIESSKAQADLTVCSIFVNPTQFNEADDFTKYPRHTAADQAKLESVNTEVLFLPSVAEVYPDGTQTPHPFDFGYLTEPMEGAHRPGHFDGMAQVVHRLLDIVQPDYLYMGQKDYQQFLIVKKMLELMDSKTQIVKCPIVRERHGLAMSSRNERLSPKNREHAAWIYRTLSKAVSKGKFKTLDIASVEDWAKAQLEKAGGIEVEYFEMVDADTLQKVEHFGDAEQMIACTAVRIGEVRLIDNMFVK